MKLHTIDDFNVRGKCVVVREDLNVPMNDGTIADYTRIDAALPTLRKLTDDGARVIVLSHLGRPVLTKRGKPNKASRLKDSLRPVAHALTERLGKNVAFANDCIGPIAQCAADVLRDGEIVLLENVRFHAGEETNDPQFARDLAKLGDLYVNDAFGTAHRAHASTEGIAHLLPHAAGLVMQAELAALGKLIDRPAQPYVCVIGGAKVKDKISVFTSLMERVQAFCIGGGMANTFLAAQGIDVGKSLRDDDLEPARNILNLAKQKNIAMHLPTDAVAAPSFNADNRAHVIQLGSVPAHLGNTPAQLGDASAKSIGKEMILDIGPATAQAYAKVIEVAKTIVFNGPMGVYEKPAYQRGTRVIGEAIAAATKKGAISIVGGGDAAAAAHMLGFADAMTHVSTGGGATLEFLEGKTLPGIAALMTT